MPVQVQCCGLFSMLLLLYFYKSQKRINLRTGKAFERTFFMSILCICFDILSCIAIVYDRLLPVLLVRFICKTYLVTLVSVAYFAMLYICADIYKKGTDYKRAIRQYAVLIFAGICLIYVLPIEYTYDNARSVLYSYGPSANATYACAFALIMMIIIRMRRERDRITPKRREAVLIWMGAWMLSALIQLFNPTILLVGYASYIGIMVLYLMLENPGNNLDRQTGLFNHSAFLRYAAQLYDTETRFSLLSINLLPSAFRAPHPGMEEAVRVEILTYLSGITDALLFKNTETELLLLYESSAKAEDDAAMLRRRFAEYWGKDLDVLVTPDLIFIPDSAVTASVEKLLSLVKYVRRNDTELAVSHFKQVGTELALEMYREEETEQLISDAMAEGRVEVFYQPIYSTKEGRFTSAEALVRIRDEQGTLIPPGRFIGTAEKSGMIAQLGEIVFDKVCRFICENDIRSYGLHYIEVNLSVIQCSDERLSADYIRIMEQNGLNAGYINLEITETASIGAKKTLLENMRQLLDYGVRFSLDDFGTGQSNLNYIMEMPVDIVKFDKQMTNAYFENQRAKYVMDATIQMIHGMNLKIVSEGIETAEQYQAMEALGISYIQGFYFSKPLPEQEFLQFLRDKSSAQPLSALLS